MATKKIMALRGLIYSKYDSEASMAKVMGWSRQRLGRITNGYKIPDVNDINDIAEALDTSVGTIATIFLAER